MEDADWMGKEVIGCLVQRGYAIRCNDGYVHIGVYMGGWLDRTRLIPYREISFVDSITTIIINMSRKENALVSLRSNSRGVLTLTCSDCLFEQSALG